LPKVTRDTEVPADDAGEETMNIIYRWAASKLLEDWTETTWWAEAVLPEFQRDSSDFLSTGPNPGTAPSDTSAD
jgi:hypothetical protein